MHKNKSVFVVFEEFCDWMAKRKFPNTFKSPHTEFVIEDKTQPETAIDAPDSEKTELEKNFSSYTRISGTRRNKSQKKKRHRSALLKETN